MSHSTWKDALAPPAEPDLTSDVLCQVALATAQTGTPALAAIARHYLATQAVLTQVDSILAPREVQVLRLLALGYSNKEIAAKLGVSVKSVETYKARYMEKLGLNGRVATVRYAARLGWLTPNAHGIAEAADERKEERPAADPPGQESGGGSLRPALSTVAHD